MLSITKVKNHVYKLDIPSIYKEQKIDTDNILGEIKNFKLQFLEKNRILTEEFEDEFNKTNVKYTERFSNKFTETKITKGKDKGMTLIKFLENKDFIGKNFDVNIFNKLVKSFCKKISSLTKDNPLLLINECFVDYCPLSRHHTRTRDIIANILRPFAEKLNVICSICSGGLFFDLLLLCSCDWEEDKTLIIVDYFRDLLQLLGKSLKNGETKIIDLSNFEYDGPNDDHVFDRAKSMIVLTLRFISFLTFIKNFEKTHSFTLIVCDGVKGYKNYLYNKMSVNIGSYDKPIFNRIPPQLIYGIDLIDDKAKFQLGMFFETCFLTPKNPMCFNFSTGNIQAFRVKKPICYDNNNNNLETLFDKTLKNNADIQHEFSQNEVKHSHINYIFNLIKLSYQLDNNVKKRIRFIIISLILLILSIIFFVYYLIW